MHREVCTKKVLVSRERHDNGVVGVHNKSLPA